MRSLSLLFLVLSLSLVSWADYSYGVVRDSDGWTNVRHAATLDSKVATTVKDGEVVLVVQTLGDFYDVLVLEVDPDKPDQFGYVHKSRVTGIKPALGAGVIQDPDGWSNIRSGPSSNSSVVTKWKVRDGAFVVISRSGEWYKVKTRSGSSGYLHQSRIEWVLPRN